MRPRQIFPAPGTFKSGCSTRIHLRADNSRIVTAPCQRGHEMRDAAAGSAPAFTFSASRSAARQRHVPCSPARRSSFPRLYQLIHPRLHAGWHRPAGSQSAPRPFPASAHRREACSARAEPSSRPPACGSPRQRCGAPGWLLVEPGTSGTSGQSRDVPEKAAPLLAGTSGTSGTSEKEMAEPKRHTAGAGFMSRLLPGRFLGDAS